MISIIVSSQSTIQASKLLANVEQTIGAIFEFIVIENANAKYSISEAYNIGAAKSKYDILCFIHEDILLETINWGNLLIQNFTNNREYGVLGLAGSNYKSSIPSSWDAAGAKASRVNIFQVNKQGQKYHDYINPHNETISQVVVLDGVWFSCQKNIFNQLKFNQEFLKGFHGYDTDFSLRANAITKIGVMYNIDITHFSLGSFKQDWLVAQLLLHKTLFKDKNKLFYSTKNKRNVAMENNTYKATFKPMCIQKEIKMEDIKTWLKIANPSYSKAPFFTIKNYIRAIQIRKK